jgi:adenylate cyclase
LSKVIFPADEGRTVHLPVDQKGRLQVNFLGPSRPFSLDDAPEQRGVFPHISLVDIARGNFDKEAVKGKIVIVAVTAIGTFDQRVTPFTPIAPGVEVHAAAIQSMVTGDALLRNRDFMLIEMLVAIILALLLGVLYRAVGLLWGVIVTLGFCGIWAGAVYVLFLSHNWFHQIPIQGQIILTWAGITLYGYLTEGREKAQLKKEFSTVLAPTVVDQLLKNPALAGLGGDERELTVMFSDIRGFTSMSEKMTPEGLTQFLNEYLTPMTDILIQRQGTLDKYMGDAIMAFWGAPIAQADHAARACLAALDMMDKLHQLQAKWHKEGKPEIDIGIGLNTGLMRVGFMGSERMRNYTLLGDNVNLGSRLEGINKSYKTNIIVSEFTYEAAKDAVYGRVIDAVRVKGKLAGRRRRRRTSSRPSPTRCSCTGTSSSARPASASWRSPARAI